MQSSGSVSHAFARTMALLLAIAIAGCARVDGVSTSRHPWTRPHVLRLIANEEPDTLNPLVGYAQIEVTLSMFWGGYLFNWSNRDRFVPELATMVPTTANGGISRDGRSITYHLRHGVKWQDGAPFTAADVVFSYDAVMNPRNNVQSRDGYDLIDRITKIDDATLVVHLRRRYAPFVATFFTMSATTYPVLPVHLLRRYPDLNHVPFNEHPIGTGPFTVVAWNHGNAIRFAANPIYWRGKPKLDQIVYQPVSNENTVLTLLRTHEADLDFMASPAQVREFRAIDGNRVEITPSTQYQFYAFNLSSPVLADARVRQALVAATDRAALVANVTHGVQRAGEGDQPPYSIWSDPRIVAAPYDPLKARRLLDAAGWHAGPDGIRVKDGRRLSINLATLAGSAAGTSATIQTQRWWRDVGIDVSIKTYLTPIYAASYAAGGILQSGKFDVAYDYWFNGVDPDNSSLFACRQMPPSGWNIYRFCDNQVEALERAALDTNDERARQHAYHAISRVLLDRRPFETLWFIQNVNVYNSDLQNFKPAHAVTEFWNPWELDI